MTITYDTDGIRSYGPGKFDLVIDEYIYQCSLDGPDEELGDVGDFGWYGILDFGDESALEAIQDVPDFDLTEDERDFLARQKVAVISEDSQGFVSVDYYERPAEAWKYWHTLESEYQKFCGEEEDDSDSAVLPDGGTL